MYDSETKNKYLRVGLAPYTTHLKKDQATDCTLHNILKELGLKLILAVRARPPKS